MERKPTDNHPDDPRVAGLATVGWITLAALGISIPLTAVGGAFAGWVAGLLPLGIIIGSGIMAMRIWSSGERLASTKENEALQERVRDLEARLANLEMVDSLEAHLAQRHQAPRREGGPVQDTPAIGPAREEIAS